MPTTTKKKTAKTAKAAKSRYMNNRQVKAKLTKLSGQLRKLLNELDDLVPRIPPGQGGGVKTANDPANP